MGLIVVCRCNKHISAGRTRKEGVRLALTNKLPHCRNKECGRKVRIHPDQIIYQDLVEEVRRELHR